MSEILKPCKIADKYLLPCVHEKVFLLTNFPSPRPVKQKANMLRTSVTILMAKQTKNC